LFVQDNKLCITS